MWGLINQPPVNNDLHSQSVYDRQESIASILTDFPANFPNLYNILIFNFV